MLTAQAIKNKAREIGFDLCGIAPVEDFPELSFLREWVDRGYAGDMRFMVRSVERRADVRAALPGARSVIMTGTLYNTLGADVASAPGSHAAGRALPDTIARYAWGDDYHDVLTGRLHALLTWMHAESADGFHACRYVDTGPVQERVYAQYAGLGWIGKNTCLINPELGSWLYLAEIITTLPLTPDPQGLEQCGACTRCLDACPTGALVEPGVLDATRCLSYLTIELRAAIPEALRPALGSHVYGCDICQDVCPYNEAPVRTTDPAWQPRDAFAPPNLIDLWRRSDEALRQVMQGSAMRRVTLRTLRRNLAVAMGNSGDPAARVALGEAREDQPSARDAIVQAHVRWALGRLQAVS